MSADGEKSGGEVDCESFKDGMAVADFCDISLILYRDVHCASWGDVQIPECEMVTIICSLIAEDLGESEM